MPVRTGYVATQSAGDVLTSANFTKLPGGWIGYANVTANQTGITAITDLTNLTVTVTVGTNRLIQITGFGSISTTANDNNGSLYVRESSTQLARSQQWLDNTLVPTGTYVACLLNAPSAGAHTYKLSLEATASAGLEAASTRPAFILVEDLGPSS